jgi:hypothetical protein
MKRKLTPAQAEGRRAAAIAAEQWPKRIHQFRALVDQRLAAIGLPNLDDLDNIDLNDLPEEEDLPSDEAIAAVIQALVPERDRMLRELFASIGLLDRKTYLQVVKELRVLFPSLARSRSKPREKKEVETAYFQKQKAILRERFGYLAVEAELALAGQLNIDLETIRKRIQRGRRSSQKNRTKRLR